MQRLDGKLRPIILAGVIALIGSGVGGLIVNYGWSKAVDVQIGGLCKSVDKLESSIHTLFKITSDNSLTNAEQRQQIEALKDRFRYYERLKNAGGNQ